MGAFPSETTFPALFALCTWIQIRAAKAPNIGIPTPSPTPSAVLLVEVLESGSEEVEFRGGEDGFKSVAVLFPLGIEVGADISELWLEVDAEVEVNVELELELGTDEVVSRSDSFIMKYADGIASSGTLSLIQKKKTLDTARSKLYSCVTQVKFRVGSSGSIFAIQVD